MKFLDYVHSIVSCPIMGIKGDDVEFILSEKDNFVYIKLGKHAECKIPSLLHELGHKWRYDKGHTKFTIECTFEQNVMEECIASIWTCNKLLKHKQKRLLREWLVWLESNWTDGFYAKALRKLKSRLLWKRCKKFCYS